MKIYTFLLIILVFFTGCVSEDAGDATKISLHFIAESHSFGEDCIKCHSSNGTGDGWFTIAGSVYDYTKKAPYKNGTIGLSSTLGGTVNETVQVDELGNFYTTEPVNLNNVFVSVFTRENKRIDMNQPVSTGRCISCHNGTTVEHIWAQ